MKPKTVIWRPTKRHSRIAFSTLFKSDMIFLRPKKDTIIERMSANYKKVIHRKMTTHNLLEGQYSFPLPKGRKCLVYLFGWKKGKYWQGLPCDYYSVNIDDFDWEVRVGVNTKK